MTTVCDVILGTYEKLILGYQLVQKEDDKWSFEIAFTNNSHLAPVRCLAVSAARGILASAGSDEAIRLLDLKKRVEVGSLPYHSGSVNVLHFYKGSHLFSGSDDGKLVVWRRRDWRLLKSFRRHRGQPVKGVAVHPTGCLALSVGNDKTLRTWDLVAGKNAFSINLKQPAEAVLWSPDGSYFAAVFDHYIDVYSTKTGRVCATFPEDAKAKNESTIISPSKKITTATFISDEDIVFGTEAGRIFSANVAHASESKQPAVSEIQAHSLRVKGIVLVSSPSKGVVLIVTGSSDGEMKLWRHRLSTGANASAKTNDFECLSTFKTNFRILSMAVWHPQPAQAQVKKAKAEGKQSDKKSTSENVEPKKMKKKKLSDQKKQ